MYKLLVTDIDGTLINDQHQITRENIDALKKAEKMGVTVMIATGRMHFGTLELWKKIGLKSPVIAVQGSMIFDPNNEKVHFSDPLEKENVLKILKYIRENNLYAHVYDEKGFICNKTNSFTFKYEEITKTPGEEHEDVENYISENGCYKVMIIDTTPRMEITIEETKKLFGDIAEITSSNFYMLEFLKKGVSKGRAVMSYADMMKIKPEEIIACGDGLNDLSMIKAAGLGVAVSNAAEGLKIAADYIAPTNNENAIAHVVEKFILNKEKL